MARRAVVTGVASGIGAETARVLVAEGYEVIGLDRNPPTQPLARYIPIDLSDPGSIDAVAGQIDGPVHALCNVAGLPPTAGAVPTMKVNFFGLRQFTDALIPKLADGAAIVNVASLAGAGWQQNIAQVKRCLANGTLANAETLVSQEGIGDDRCYFVSKECLIVWTLASWSRWRDRGIRMNVVSPGPVLTPIHADFLATLGERASQDAERVERPARPDEIAPVIAFLCSDASRWVRAANIAVDTGLFAAALQEEFGF